MANVTKRTMRAKKTKTIVTEDELFDILSSKEPNITSIEEFDLINFIFTNSLCVLCSDGSKIGEFPETEVTEVPTVKEDISMDIIEGIEDLSFLDDDRIEITEGMTFRDMFLSIRGSWKEFFLSVLPLADDIERAIYTKNELLIKEPWTQRSFFPNRIDLLRAFNLTPLDTVNVVILGQDPYPNLGTDCQPRATGLSFSVREGEAIPPSLVNIFRELEATVPSFSMPSHGNLESWARQGILMINSSLTVYPDIAASHSAIWKAFTKSLIQYVSDKRPGTIFVLWGSHARGYSRLIKKTCKILEAGHPSTSNLRGGFRGCNHFNLINNELLSSGKAPIQWNLDRMNPMFQS